MSMIVAVFYTFALLALLGALIVLFAKRLMHSALGLLLSLISSAGLYVLAGADFLGVAQLMVYVGGVLVLLLFGVMLVGRRGPDALKVGKGRIVQAGALASALLAVMGCAIYEAGLAQKEALAPGETIQALGQVFMTSHVLPFEAIAVLLLAALVGALQIAKGNHEWHASDGGRES